MPVMLILQGAQGSGKSTLAKVVRSLLYTSKEGCVVVSTDDEFTVNPTGRYLFDPAKLAENHAKTQAKAKRCAENGYNIVVDNCNSQAWEARPYVEIALDHGYSVHFFRCEGRHPNIHGVPEDRVEMVRQRMETLTVENCMVAKAPWEK